MNPASNFKLSLIVAMMPVANGWAQPGSTALISLSSGGVQANGMSSYPALSQDGRYVAFVSYASNLVPGDTNSVRDCFVRDRLLQSTERVSLSSGGAQGNSDCVSIAVTADGRYVAFSSSSSNLTSGDTNGSEDVFVRDRMTNQTVRVSVATSGAQGNAASHGPVSISADGRYVAYVSLASNLVASDTNAGWDVFVRDRVANTTSRVSVSSSGIQSDGFSLGCSMSQDGRFVAFDSDATNIVDNDTNNRRDIFLHDRQNLTTTRVSVSSAGVQANHQSFYPSLSGDGALIAFHSQASNLVPLDGGGSVDVFVYNRLTLQCTRASVSSLGASPNGASTNASISPDGRYVAFMSDATNIVTGDTNGKFDVFLRDLWSQQSSRVSLSGSGAQGNGHSWYPSVSGDGLLVAFSSEASNLFAGEANFYEDVFGHQPRPRVSGSAILAGYDVGTAGLPLEVQVWQGGVWVETMNVNFGLNSEFGCSPSANGPATLKFRFRTGLWKGIDVILGAVPIVNLEVNMINGDCDGDNEVGIGDYAQLSAAYGLNEGEFGFDPSADLNGDTAIDIGDFAILSASFGEAGD